MCTERLPALVLAHGALGLFSLAAAPAVAQSVVRAADLTFEEGAEPRLEAGRWLQSTTGRALLPRVVVEGHDAFFATPPVRSGINAGDLAEALVAIDIEGATAPLGGTLYLPDEYGRRLVPYAFTVQPSALRVDRDAHSSALAQHYLGLAGAGLPGTPWFRRQAVAHGGYLGAASSWGWSRGFVGTDPFAMFTGGRALAENLRLDEVIWAEEGGDKRIPIDEVDGVRVDAMSFEGLLPMDPPPFDPLARLVPEDQHAVFFPSFDALVAVADHLEDDAQPLVQAFDGRGESARVRDRYERQMLLELDGFARTAGRALFASVALTGSDPYLRTGSDVALLFECRGDASAAALRGRLAARAESSGVAMREFESHGAPVQAWIDATRSVSAYFVEVGGVAILSNSRWQMERLLALATDQAAGPRLTDAPEYEWFRGRYPLGAPGEDALVVISDAAIRRWSGPKWRVATARRTFALAVLADADAWRIASRTGATAGRTPRDRSPVIDGGELDLTGRWALDSNYGTRDFLTPIAELDIDALTSSERVGYERWRRGFEASWGAAFDPIAASIDVREDGLAVDLTLVPLVMRTAYGWMREISGSARLDAAAPAPHEGSLFFWQTAFGSDGPFWPDVNSFLVGEGAPDFDLWLGSSITVWLDDDVEYFERIREASAVDEFVDEMLPGLPVGIEIAVTDVQVARGFLEALVARVEAERWLDLEIDGREHRGVPYFALMTETELGFVTETPTLFCAATERGLVFSLSEATVRGAIERAGDGTPTPWIGQSAGLALDGDLTKAVDVDLVGTSSADQLRARSWGNLPILNEWKRLGFGDPVAAHEEAWGTRLLCPGGGEYVWNADAHTMESTAYGHPAAALDGPRIPPGLATLRGLGASLEFESFDAIPRAPRAGEAAVRALERVDGLRARMEFRR